MDMSMDMSMDTVLAGGVVTLSDQVSAIAGRRLERRVGVDLGTKCGVAVWTGPIPAHGQWLQMPAEHDLLDSRPRGPGAPANAPLPDQCQLVPLKLAASKGEGGGMRALRFERHLRELLRPDHPDGPVRELGYELVQHHSATWAAQVYGQLQGVIMRVCEEFAIPYRGVPVGTIKRTAAGLGNAAKEQVAAGVIRRFKPYSARLRDPIRKPPTLDETDALGVLACILDGVG